MDAVGTIPLSTASLLFLSVSIGLGSVISVLTWRIWRLQIVVTANKREADANEAECKRQLQENSDTIKTQSGLLEQAFRAAGFMDVAMQFARMASGGVIINADNANFGGDVIGRDKSA